MTSDYASNPDHHPSGSGMICRILVAVLALSTIVGCTHSYPKREVNYEPTKAVRANVEIPESQLLGVRIITFEPGKLPEGEDESRGISTDIRKAEGFFVAIKLKKTMEGTGQWGPVRVVPRNSRDGEVIVSGKILESDGEVLALNVTVRDSTGAEWFTKEYKGVVDKEIYKQTKQADVDAFQYLYNQIANDIAIRRQKLTNTQITQIRQVAELRFAADFAPDAFAGHLVTTKKSEEESEPSKLFSNLMQLVKSEPSADEPRGNYQIARLPSDNDPMFQRIMRIRGREHLLIDTLDQQFEVFANRITAAYTQWRVSRLDEMDAIREREAKRDEKVAQAVAVGLIGVLAGAAMGSQGNCYSCASTGAAVAAASTVIALQMATKAAEEAQADTQIRKAALEELGQSLAADVSPVVVEVEGERVKLTGTVEAKFDQWRAVLKKLHAREVGPVDTAPPPEKPKGKQEATDREPPKTS